jgi:hypothetical protein
MEAQKRYLTKGRLPIYLMAIPSGMFRALNILCPLFNGVEQVDD